MTTEQQMTNEEMARSIASLPDSDERNRLIHVLQMRLSKKLMPYARTLNLGEGETEHAVQSVLDDRILSLCGRFHPNCGAFQTYALGSLKLDLRKYSESHRCDIHLPSDLRTCRRKIHRFTREHPAMESAEMIRQLSDHMERSTAYVSFLLSVESTDELAVSAHFEDLADYLDGLGVTAPGDAYEDFYVSEAVYSLLREFDRILTPVEKYVFIRKIGLLDGRERSYDQLRTELVQRFHLRYKGRSGVAAVYQGAVTKLRAAYTRKDIVSRFH